MKKLIYQRVYMFLETKKILYKNQFRFRNKHSTNHALIDIKEKIGYVLDKKLFAAGIFIDLQKLHHYGMKSTGNNWFYTFLKYKYQFRKI